MTKNKSNLISLDHVIPAGTPYASLDGGMFIPKLLQVILSAPAEPVQDFDADGTLLKPLEELYPKIEALGGKCVFRRETSRYFLWDNHSFLHMFYSESSNDVCIGAVFTDPSLLEKIKTLAEEFITEAKNNLVFCIVKEGDRLDIKNMGDGSSALVEGNYSKDVIKDYHYVVESFKKTPSIGRIAILNGEPGTGKTHLIRSILSELDCVFLIVPSNLLEVLDKPEFMPLLLSVREDYEKPIIMIIEDGDLCLVPRENDNISSIASLLNLSDGILGSMLDIKMIISTNAMIKDMDQAILRPGRLCKQINVLPLDYNQSNKVYQRLCEKSDVTLPPRKEYTLAEIYEFFNTKDLVENVMPVKRVIGFK